MKSNQFLSASGHALISAVFMLLLPTVHAQPTAPVPAMPAEIVKPMPKTGMDIKQGTDMKQGVDMKQGMDMKPMMTDMHDKMMGMKPTGDADVDFATMMRMHHQGAITMAEAQLQNGKDAQMRTMAKNIIRDQKKEMAVFDRFLTKRSESSMRIGSPAMPMNK